MNVMILIGIAAVLIIALVWALTTFVMVKGAYKVGYLRGLMDVADTKPNKNKEQNDL